MFVAIVALFHEAVQPKLCVHYLFLSFVLHVLPSSPILDLITVGEDMHCEISLRSSTLFPDILHFYS